MRFLTQHVVVALIVAFILGQLSAAFLLTAFRAPDAFPEARDAYGPIEDDENATAPGDRQAGGESSADAERRAAGE